MSYLPCSVQSLSQTIVIFSTDQSLFSREKLWNFQLFCQASLPNFVRHLYQKLDETLKSMRKIWDAIASSVSFCENEFAADNKASLPFQLLSNIFIFLCCCCCCCFREFLWHRNQSRVIYPDRLNIFRIYFHANRSLVHWALGMPVWMNILLVKTKRKKPCIGFLKMFN